MTPSLPVVLQREIAVVGTGILPRDHEHRVALLGQVFHQRIGRAQVQDVVLLDPGRDDQHRLRPHHRRGRRVLDQFDQAIAKDHVAGRDRHVAADLELRRRPPGRLPPSARSQSSTQLSAPRSRFVPPCAQRAVENLRIGLDEVGRRNHVQELARAERDHLLVLAGDAANAGRRVVPPLLRQQERLVDRRRTAACATRR